VDGTRMRELQRERGGERGGDTSRISGPHLRGWWGHFPYFRPAPLADKAAEENDERETMNAER
jgi:hypothetical protein